MSIAGYPPERERKRPGGREKSAILRISAFVQTAKNKREKEVYISP